MAMIILKRPAILGILLAFVLLVPAGWASAQTSFDRIVVFGDSLSDPGNAFVFVGKANTPPYQLLDQLLVPDLPYAKGGHHFSNGATWVEQLARQFSLSDNTRPAFRDLGFDATNYAIGGARAHDKAGEATMTFEVTTFLNVFGGQAPPNALYVVEFGSNDIRDALEAQDPAIVEQAVATLQANIAALYNAGARKFLVCNAPDLSLTPALLATDKAMPGAAAAAHQLSLYYNFLLDYLLTSMSAQLTDLQVVKVGFFSKLDELVTNPEDFGFSVVDSPCLTPGSPPYACKNPDTFIFWDGIHPTEKVHGVIAQQALSELAK
ncbi:SGNH/GDSL hydrolase family protein [Geomonas nitrogeniifigens]|uniref:SGNH/GDSL hydrolase family protein n=1 Tax=Geomonas diazotrophica TaxID=2843197 RepID=A0ABX8JI96_9BACT|nr:SGNH/GDSL hydrolase family protein [Geomonas nitrogeniifigens]QWV96387.1 SGNH/GDSL hydrolase family protein [Geomonas nitrogeniifigens]QXE85454.1 SGNH/GDSL hydrolase family protein [Geomonas nitrogeniifigens]